MWPGLVPCSARQLRRVTGPGGQAAAYQRDDVRGQPDAGEPGISCGVQVPGRVGELFREQAGLDAEGEAGQLPDAVAVQRHGDVIRIAWLYASDERVDFPANGILDVQHGDSVDDHRGAGTIEAGHLQDHLFASGRCDDPLPQSPAEVVLPFGPFVDQAVCPVLPFCLQALSAQRGLYPGGRGLDGSLPGETRSRSAV